MEIESGSDDSRAVLRLAIALAKRTRSKLLIAKLDRLARSVSFITSLTDSAIDFAACDLPEANRLLLHVALNTAARRVELCALGWGDVDLDKKTIQIRASMSQSASGVFRKSTKTGRVRKVPLNDDAIAALRAQRSMQLADRLRVGEAYHSDPEQPVFTNEIGERVTPKSATNAFARVAKLAGLTSNSLHRLRHTGASVIIPESDHYGRSHPWPCRPEYDCQNLCPRT